MTVQSMTLDNDNIMASITLETGSARAHGWREWRGVNGASKSINLRT